MAAIELAVLGALTTPLAVTLSLKVMAVVPEDQKVASLALVTGVGALAAMISNVIAGYLSDRTTSRWGRRRPWIVGGVFGGLTAGVGLAAASSVAGVALAWVGSQAAYGATLAALSAMLADQVPEAQRSRASGIFGALGFVGIVPALTLAALFPADLIVLAVAMPLVAAVIVPILCALLPDPPVGPAPSPRSDPGVPSRAGAGPQPTRRYFVFTWIQRAVMQLGYLLTWTFGLYFLISRFGLTAVGASRTSAVATLAAAAMNAVTALTIGYLVSKRGRYGGVIALSAIGIAIGFIIRAFAADLLGFWIAVVVASAAIGAYYSVDLALAMRTLPRGREGRYLGIFNIAKTAPQVIGPAIAPLILAAGGPDPINGAPDNYFLLQLVAAGIVLLSLLTLPFLRPVLRRPEDQ
ncbi:MFS-type transporter involved in bile tolerance (Atg22 family) [Microbacterium sp. AG790]|nr:MFS-type transporter involved in bile tolerance (Atg22 family) [Microbacterium sp. AG790]